MFRRRREHHYPTTIATKRVTPFEYMGRQYSSYEAYHFEHEPLNDKASAHFYPGKVLHELVVDSTRVCKTRKSGKTYSWRIICAVGNYWPGGEAVFGLAVANKKDFRTAKICALRLAKKSLIPVKRGCGHNACQINCDKPHSVHKKFYSKVGSTKMILHPAPTGKGNVMSKKLRELLNLCGVQDSRIQLRGSTNILNTSRGLYLVLKETKCLKHIDK